MVLINGCFKCTPVVLNYNLKPYIFYIVNCRPTALLDGSENLKKSGHTGCEKGLAKLVF